MVRSAFFLKVSIESGLVWSGQIELCHLPGDRAYPGKWDHAGQSPCMKPGTHGPTCREPTVIHLFIFYFLFFYKKEIFFVFVK